VLALSGAPPSIERGLSSDGGSSPIDILAKIFRPYQRLTIGLPVIAR
jgi:hypothetical protein